MASETQKASRKAWMANGRIFVRPVKVPAPKESWWAKHAAPEADRAGFNDAAKIRHEERMATASDATRSLGKAIDP
jgi:hypothetical protein